jgi:hypothetical protein
MDVITYCLDLSMIVLTEENFGENFQFTFLTIYKAVVENWSLAGEFATHVTSHVEPDRAFVSQQD